MRNLEEAVARDGFVLMPNALNRALVAWARAASDELRPVHCDYTGIADRYTCVFNRDPG